MNWQDAPHLFANGKFQCQVTLKPFDKNIIRQINIETYYNDRFGYISQKGKFGSSVEWFYLDECTLIARKIEDMTDEEKSTWLQMKHGTGSFIHDESKSTAYILSIGVYPFDQSDFGKTVIALEENG